MAARIEFKQITSDKPTKTKAVKEFAQMPSKAEDFIYTPKFLGAWKKKGISAKALKKGMVYERNMWVQGQGPDDTMDVSCAPIFKGKALVNVRFNPLDFLDYDEKFFCEVDGAELFFVGSQIIKGLYDENGVVDYLILTNREVDRLTYLQAEYENVVLVPDGKDLNWINESVINMLSRVKVFVVAFSNDSAGIVLRDEITRRIGKEKCKLANIQSDLQGVNDYLDCDGPFRSIKEVDAIEKVKFTVTTAKPLQISGIYVVSDFNAEINDLYKNGFPEGFKTGKLNVDRGMTIYPGCFSLLTGTPGTGKSTLLKCLYPKYHEQSKISGKYLKMGMYSAEDKSEAMAFAKIIQNKTGKYVTPHENQLTQLEYAQAKEWLNENFILIRPQSLNEWLKQKNVLGANTLDGILMYAELCVIMYGMNWLVIDNWATIEKDYNKGENQDVYTGRALSKISEFAIKWNCHITLVAHPTKTEVDAHGNFKMINLYNVSGSAHFYNFPDLGIILKRDRYRPATQAEAEKYYDKHKKEMPKGTWIRDYMLPTEVHIDKVREDWMGELSHFNCYMDKYRGKSFVFNKDELHRTNKKDNIEDNKKAPEQQEFDLDGIDMTEEPPF
jgi:energy-coupling factor transporter ATP-binding protein EcfA2